MTHRINLIVALAAGLLGVGWAFAADQKAVTGPDVAGEWTGTWGPYSPAQAPRPTDQPQKAGHPPLRLDCKVAETADGQWQATFEGEAGRPYQYRIAMPGRRVGNTVLFKGTVDLGPKDGGVYDWIGRATETEFIGFYTSQFHTGTFQLARPKTEAAK